MAIDDYDGETIRSGRWLYDGLAPVDVAVVVFDCDFFKDRLLFGDEPDPRRPMRVSGKLFYYLKFDGLLIDTDPFATAELALDWAKANGYAIEWNDEPFGKA